MVYYYNALPAKCIQNVKSSFSMAEMAKNWPVAIERF